MYLKLIGQAHPTLLAVSLSTAALEALAAVGNLAGRKSPVMVSLTVNYIDKLRKNSHFLLIKP